MKRILSLLVVLVLSLSLALTACAESVSIKPGKTARLRNFLGTWVAVSVAVRDDADNKLDINEYMTYFSYNVVPTLVIDKESGWFSSEGNVFLLEVNGIANNRLEMTDPNYSLEVFAEPGDGNMILFTQGRLVFEMIPGELNQVTPDMLTGSSWNIADKFIYLGEVLDFDLESSFTYSFNDDMTFTSIVSDEEQHGTYEIYGNVIKCEYENYLDFLTYVDDELRMSIESEDMHYSIVFARGE